MIKRTNTQAAKIKERAEAAHKQKLMDKEAEIEGMSPEHILFELKNKGLQVFGTIGERKERLKRHYGISPFQSPKSKSKQGKRENICPEMGNKKKGGVVERIEEMKHRREERRRRMQEEKQYKLERAAENMAVGKFGDIDYEMLIEKFKQDVTKAKPHTAPDSLKISVCVRKRPLFKKELQAGEIDCVTVTNPSILVHECKFRVDGITKYLDNQSFQFDNVIFLY